MSMSMLPQRLADQQFMKLAYMDKHDVVSLLLEAGADPNMASNMMVGLLSW